MDIEKLSGKSIPENNKKLENDPLNLNLLYFEQELAELRSFAELINPDDPAEVENAVINLANAQIGSKHLKAFQGMTLRNRMLQKSINLKDLHLAENLKELSEKKIRVDMDSLKEYELDFLKQCTENQNFVINQIQPDNNNVSYNISDGQISYRSMDFSKGLSNLIEYAYKSQKPVRLDFDNNSSLILRIDAEGKLSAEFIASNKAMEDILRNNVPQLKQKFDLEGIPYKEIAYKERNKRNKEEDERS